MGTRGQSGNVILLLLLGLFVLGVVGGGIFLLSPSKVGMENRTAEEARAAYDEAVASLDRALKDPRNVQDSLERNHSSFDCLFRSDGDCRGKGGAFLLYDVSQMKRPLSNLARDSGVDSLGRACKGFPSAACPLQVETVWEPVCSGPRCENTQSIKVKAKVTLAPILENQVPLEWTRESTFTPQIALSGAASCERGGGVWANTECLTATQAAERQIASSPKGKPDAITGPAPDAREERPADPQMPPQYECPNQIVVQGQYYPVQWLTADRGQVSVPAMSCPAAGLTDVFVFQCAAKNPATFPNEGQWIQVEAVMSPPCDEQGNPVGGAGRY